MEKPRGALVLQAKPDEFFEVTIAGHTLQIMVRPDGCPSQPRVYFIGDKKFINIERKKRVPRVRRLVEVTERLKRGEVKLPNTIPPELRASVISSGFMRCPACGGSTILTRFSESGFFCADCGAKVP